MLKINMPKDLSLIWGSSFIQVTGPIGTLIKRKDNFSICIHNNKIFLWSDTGAEKEQAYLSWLKALIIGVTKGYSKKLKLIGVGFRGFLIKDKLHLKIGYSHEVIYNIPENIVIIPSKGKGTLLLVKGKELQKVNQVAAEIRNLRAPDSYKGKGIHYYDEIIILKKGKRENK